MDRLPDEILIDILDYLEPFDVVSAQRVSPRLLKIARDSTLWRYKCFEKAPSATNANVSRSSTSGASTGNVGALLGLIQSTSGNSDASTNSSASNLEQLSNISQRAKAVSYWDHSGFDERIDWYSEYVARHAPLSTEWLGSNGSQIPEIRGLHTFDNATKVVGCLDDGAVGIWDIREPREGRRKIFELARSKEGLLLEDHTSIGPNSTTRKRLAFGGVVDCVTVDSNRQRAYFAVQDMLNEVDINTLQVISQNKYAWDITALSNQNSDDMPITVGTCWSLHLFDPRAPSGDRFRSPETMMRKVPSSPEDTIAFLPNYKKGELPYLRDVSENLSLSPDYDLVQRVGESWVKHWQTPKPHMSDYAYMETGPLSILHHQENEILVAGRFPSILSYDRRYFPRLQNAIHSGARLSCLSSIPYAPRAAHGNDGAEATLVACGEYGGRGSLELYSLPHNRRSSTNHSTGIGSDGDLRFSTQVQPGAGYPYTYKNRQEASSSKLLSVATQGTRIVFSDAEGGLKWVERDGRGLARRWNVNPWQMNERGATVSGEQVVRKIIPLETTNSERGKRGDGDLLVWTGDNIGIISTKPQWADHEELVDYMETNINTGHATESEMADEYSKAMRRALERQADERRWMSQFRLKRGLY